MSTIYDLIKPDDNENYIRIKQATKQGYILMEDGGGNRPVLSIIKIKKG